MTETFYLSRRHIESINGNFGINPSHDAILSIDDHFVVYLVGNRIGLYDIKKRRHSYLITEVAEIQKLFYTRKRILYTVTDNMRSKVKTFNLNNPMLRTPVSESDLNYSIVLAGPQNLILLGVAGYPYHIYKILSQSLKLSKKYNFGSQNQLVFYPIYCSCICGKNESVLAMGTIPHHVEFVDIEHGKVMKKTSFKFGKLREPQIQEDKSSYINNVTAPKAMCAAMTYEGKIMAKKVYNIVIGNAAGFVGMFEFPKFKGRVFTGTHSADVRGIFQLRKDRLVSYSVNEIIIWDIKKRKIHQTIGYRGVNSICRVNDTTFACWLGKMNEIEIAVFNTNILDKWKEVEKVIDKNEFPIINQEVAEFPQYNDEKFPTPVPVVKLKEKKKKKDKKKDEVLGDSVNWDDLVNN